MKISLFLFFVLFITKTQANQWHFLLDNELSQWDTYLSYRHSESYDGSIPKDENGQSIAPIGLNTGNEQHQVFTVVTEDSHPVLKISGEIYGALTTKSSYKNYHLKLKMRWGDKKWPPRLDKLMDSGILYHAIGEHGKEHFRSWMLSQEFQIMQGHMGDYWSQANSAIDIRAYPREYIMSPVADETQHFLKVGKGEKTQGFVMRKEKHERPNGKWNELELICFEGKSLHIVNGEVVMVLRNSRYLVNGVSKPMIEGKLQIQSEAAELFYKDIAIRKLGKLPAKYASLFE